MIIALLLIITILLLILVISNKRSLNLLYRFIATSSLIAMAIFFLAIFIGAIILFYYIDIEIKMFVIVIPIMLALFALVGLITYLSVEKISGISDKIYDRLKINVKVRHYYTAVIWIVSVISIYLLFSLVFDFLK